MTIIVLLSRKMRWLVVALIGLFILIAVNRQLQLTSTSPYQIRAQFPPLVFLPDYNRLGPKIGASAAVLIEAQSGAVLYGKNAEVRRAPASTTKMMTAIVALEKGRLSQVVKVSRKAAATGGSTIWLKAGDRLTLKELLEGMMLRSGNDGSVAVAEGVCGSVKDFVRLMNLKAKEIGALQTNFQNPHGLRAPSHYTTALDLALIARYGMENPYFAKLVRSKTGTLEWFDRKKQVEIRNTNRLLWYFEGADGIKTGTTNEAGHCLVGSAVRDGKRLIAVVLNSRDRWSDCARLLEYGFEAFTIRTIATTNQAVARVSVRGGNRKTVPVYPRSNLVAVVRKDAETAIKPQLRLPDQPLRAPLAAGQAVGSIGYRYHDQWVEGVDLVVRKPVRRQWWWFW
ncbi:MAG TPA: D-alanyl-D-alanine carboxypeptidase family protein [Bacillota bacterium]|nr:D-alanyl-D-alanine carboxypeptidase family protein [Bacillota bacterium]HPT86712.1 D-alanyl-D-alanine carboxypeptidase family protein [Bacillota bacterium]